MIPAELYTKAVGELGLMLRLLATFGAWLDDQGVRCVRVMKPEFGATSRAVCFWRVLMFTRGIRLCLKYVTAATMLDRCAPSNYSQSFYYLVLRGGMSRLVRWNGVAYIAENRTPHVNTEDGYDVATPRRLVPYRVNFDWVMMPLYLAGTIVLTVGVGEVRGTSDLPAPWWVKAKH